MVSFESAMADQLAGLMTWPVGITKEAAKIAIISLKMASAAVSGAVKTCAAVRPGRSRMPSMFGRVPMPLRS